MSQSVLSVRVEDDVKRNFDTFCSSAGLNPSVAVNMFIKATLREGRIPFEISTTREKHKAKKSLEERFEGYAGDYKCSEYDWGDPVGNELW